MPNREETEQKLMALLKDVVAVYNSYNPDGEYLTLTYCCFGLNINNEYWERDSHKPIDCHSNVEV